MNDVDNILDLFIDNIKKLFFPEEWIKIDLKFSKYEIFTMLFIDRKSEVTMTELVGYINCPMSTATGIVDRLVRNGYVSRSRSETDRRIVVLKLTDAGCKFIKDLRDTVSKYLKIILEDLTGEEKQFLIGIAFKIMNKLQADINIMENTDEDKRVIKKIDIE